MRFCFSNQPDIQKCAYCGLTDIIMQLLLNKLYNYATAIWS